MVADAPAARGARCREKSVYLGLGEVLTLAWTPKTTGN
jgi:hypothetical protein